MRSVSLTCNGCGRRLLAISRRIRELEEQMRQLRRQLREAEDEVEHLGGGFVASSIRHTFHRESCRWVVNLLKSKNLREFSSHQEAIDDGYRPCKTCCA